MSAELGQVRFRGTLRQDLAINASPFDLGDVVDLDTRHVFHRHHALRGEIPEDIGHLCGASAGGVPSIVNITLGPDAEIVCQPTCRLHLDVRGSADDE